jgi:competence protein ComEC
VGQFWHGPQVETPEYALLMEALAERKIPTETLLAGDAVSGGGAVIRVLWPRPDAASSLADDRSLVLRISAGGVNFLLPADAGTDAQSALLASGNSLESQVLALPAYGGKAPERGDFVQRVDPRIAIVSSEGGETAGGRMNGEIELLSQAGVGVFRTSVAGATTVQGSPGGLVVYTYRSSGAETIKLARERQDSNPPTASTRRPSTRRGKFESSKMLQDIGVSSAGSP